MQVAALSVSQRLIDCSYKASWKSRFDQSMYEASSVYAAAARGPTWKDVGGREGQLLRLIEVVGDVLVQRQLPHTLHGKLVLWPDLRIKHCVSNMSFCTHATRACHCTVAWCGRASHAHLTIFGAASVRQRLMDFEAAALMSLAVL